MEKFFTPGWVDMVGGELRALLSEQPRWRACSLSLVEYFRDAPPLGLPAPFDVAGIRLDLIAGVFQLRRGLLTGESATLVVHSFWDDAAIAASMPNGEQYQRFCQWRIAAGRFDKSGDAGEAAPLLALLHDRIAVHTMAEHATGHNTEGAPTHD